MPSFTTFVEDCSPLLKYSGEWYVGSSEDNLASRYTQSSFMVSQKRGSSVSFLFYGSSVSVIGSKRPNHGNYHAQIDGTVFPQTSGAATPEVFNSTLFSAQVDLGLHNVTLINDADFFIDIDYISFDTSIGKSSEQLIVNTYQDTHPSFDYSPMTAWRAPTAPGSFLGSSGHVSNSPSVSAVFTFQTLTIVLIGAVALYGPVGPNNTQVFSVRVDNGTPSMYTSQNSIFRPQQLLYFTSNLGPGAHSLTIQTQNANGELAIDYANVYTTPSLGGSFGTNITVPFQVAVNSNHIPTAILAALSVSSSFAFFSLIAFIWIFIRRRRELRERRMMRSGFNEKRDSTHPFPFPNTQSPSDVTQAFQSYPSHGPPSSTEYANSIYPPSSEAGASVRRDNSHGGTARLALHTGPDRSTTRIPAKFRPKQHTRGEEPLPPPEYTTYF